MKKRNTHGVCEYLKLSAIIHIQILLWQSSLSAPAVYIVVLEVTAPSDLLVKLFMKLFFDTQR